MLAMPWRTAIEWMSPYENTETSEVLLVEAIPDQLAQALTDPGHEESPLHLHKLGGEERLATFRRHEQPLDGLRTLELVLRILAEGALEVLLVSEQAQRGLGNDIPFLWLN